ncbi:hypothetical protein QBC37DRAFT_301944, partial [Rhypophila decipiens]
MAKKQTAFIKRLNGVSYGLPPKEATQAVRTVVLPTLLYGYEAYFRPDTRGKTTNVIEGRLNSLLRDACRAAIPAWKTTPIPVLHAHTGILPARQLLQWRGMKHLFRNKNLPLGH